VETDEIAMKHRLAFIFIGLLIAINVFAFLPDREFKRSMQEKIAYAIRYYKDRAWHYYLQATGQIPPPIVAYNQNEWMHFETACDALLIDYRTSIDWFGQYLDIHKGAMKALYEEFRKNEPRVSKRPFARRMSHLEGFAEFQKIRQKIVGRFLIGVRGDLAEEECRTMETILLHPYTIPVAELRALRRIPLRDEQRTSLHPFAHRLAQAMAAYSPQYPGDDVHPGEEKRVELCKQEFLSHVQDVLSPAQIDQWKSQIGRSQSSVREFCQFLDKMRADILSWEKQWGKKSQQPREKEALPPNGNGEKESMPERIVTQNPSHSS